MKKILFVDRDGTLIVEPPDTFQIDTIAEISLIPGVISALKRFVQSGYEIVVVTNQDGLGTEANPRENYEAINRFLFDNIFASEGIDIAAVFECPHFPDDDCACRKPNSGILKDFLQREKVDLAHSLMVGDRESDREFANNICVQGFLLADHSWEQIADAVLQQPRIATIERKTKETEIAITLNLDGSGRYRIDTGLKFFDHMLEQLAKHGGFDLDLTCRGDLEIDEHHTIEDVALALGKCFKKALGDKRGIERYSWERILPMDEAKAEIAMDFSGRPFLVFQAEFHREYVGDFPTELLEHFYQSFCEKAGLNLHMTLSGSNTHHLIEASFKGFARCLKDAVRQSGSSLPSTKGVL